MVFLWVLWVGSAVGFLSGPDDLQSKITRIKRKQKTDYGFLWGF